MSQQDNENFLGIQAQVVPLDAGALLVHARFPVIDPLGRVTTPINPLDQVEVLKKLGEKVPQNPQTLVQKLKALGVIPDQPYAFQTGGERYGFQRIDKVVGYAIGLGLANRIRDERPFVRRTDPTAAIIGSFKYKDEIDALIDKWGKNGLTVLAPPKGGVISEKKMTSRHWR